MERYGVIDSPTAMMGGLNAALLMFDKVVLSDFAGVQQAVSKIDDPSTPEWDADEMWNTRSAIESDLGWYLYDISRSSFTAEIEKYIADSEFLIDNGLVVVPQYDDVLYHLKPWQQNLFFDESALKAALHTRYKLQVSTYVVHSPSSVLEVPDKLDKTHVMQLVLKSFPIPSKDVPLTEIVEFRETEEHRAKLWALRSWMDRIQKEVASPEELEDQLMSLLTEYKAHMKILEAKNDLVNFETTVATAPEFVENILRLAPGKAVRNLLSFRHKKLDLKTEELELPGKEVAYLYAMEEAFSSNATLE